MFHFVFRKENKIPITFHFTKMQSHPQIFVREMQWLLINFQLKSILCSVWITLNIFSDWLESNCLLLGTLTHSQYKCTRTRNAWISGDIELQSLEISCQTLFKWKYRYILKIKLTSRKFIRWTYLSLLQKRQDLLKQ